ncbi:MAG: STAS domain-containing protein [Planctomycetes bacterium]|nr:STAS domain-containing protein [Planctomycetota bacterium]
MVLQNKLLMDWMPNQNGVAQVSIKGYIDHSNCKDFEQSLLSGVSNNTKLVLINCTELDYMNSGGFSSLLNILELKKKNDLKIALLNINKRLRDIITMLGLDSMFIIANTPDEVFAKNKT